jgi:hypothetical protein
MWRTVQHGRGSRKGRRKGNLLGCQSADERRSSERGRLDGLIGRVTILDGHLEIEEDEIVAEEAKPNQ